MNEARVLNFTFIGLFVIMLVAFVFAVQVSSSGVVGASTVTTTVSAFCG